MSKLLPFLLLLFVSSTVKIVTADVVRSQPITVVKGGLLGLGAGVVQYYYEDNDDSSSVSTDTDADDGDNSDSACEAVVILIVGTAMRVGQYVDLAQAIVTGSSSTVVAIMDDNIHWIQKQNGKRATNVANAVVENLPKYVPVCSQAGVPRYYFGGHSAGGGGAMNAMKTPQKFDFDVAGFIGLSPYGMKKHISLHVPTLLWDFSLMSCGVCPKTAAQQVYNDMKKNVPRFFYQLQTNNTVNFVLGGDHCSYTDSGCFRMCSGGKTGRNFMHESVAKAINTFVGGATTVVENYDNVKLYTGMEEVVVPPEKPEAWLVRPWVKIVCFFVP
mmetsp:Transcript_12345/g.14146  ORF Transcript_12345/g.14146 Transcript_12345/m.14146 type:complete len:329 (-) Transcript_12345:44-1030(-)